MYVLVVVEGHSLQTITNLFWFYSFHCLVLKAREVQLSFLSHSVMVLADLHVFNPLAPELIRNKWTRIKQTRLHIALFIIWRS